MHGYFDVTFSCHSCLSESLQNASEIAAVLFIFQQNHVESFFFFFFNQMAPISYCYFEIWSKSFDTLIGLL